MKLSDQFGDSEAKVVARTSLCNPVSKNGGEILDRRRTSSATGSSRAGGSSAAASSCATSSSAASASHVLRPTQLCLPSGKTEQDGQRTEIPELDHYQCYAVRPLGPRQGPQGAPARPVRRRAGARAQAPRLCNPVSKDGGEIRNKRDHLVCSRIVPATRFDPRKVFVTNQFERNSTLEAVARQRLCLPSRKTLVP